MEGRYGFPDLYFYFNAVPCFKILACFIVLFAAQPVSLLAEIKYGTFLMCLSQLYDQVTGGVICHGEKSFLTDGRKSFPSGHTSCKFVPLTCMSTLDAILMDRAI
jgi:hypothetical protein